jgi:DNA topoisomerase-1
VQAIEAVAEKLGNTPSVCRKCYVHPAVIESYLDGTMLHALQERTRQELVEDIHALSPEEAAVVALLQRRLQSESAASPPGAPKKKPRASRANRSARDAGPGAARPRE